MSSWGFWSVLRKEDEDLFGFIWTFGPVYFIKIIVLNIHTKM